MDYKFKMLWNTETRFEVKPDDLDFLAESLSTADTGLSESPITAGFVYLGQFIDHDIIFDSMSRRDDPSHHPWGAINISKIRNLRKPVFDLETIYGYEKPKNERELARKDLMKPNSKTLLNLGETYQEPMAATTAKFPFPNDLPREKHTATARIVDPRNDENLILAQTQVAFMKFHNAIVHKLISEQNFTDSCFTFRKARKIAIRHFQHIILKDFLPTLVSQEIIDEIKAEVVAGTNKHYNPTRGDFYIPFEFSTAAFRVGHSMIRNDYNYNLLHLSDTAILYQILSFTGGGGKINIHNNENKLPSTWIINWNWFYDFSAEGEEKDKKLNFAKPIDTKFSSSLNNLIPKIPLTRINSLAALDLFRGFALGLPTGQEVAKQLTTEDKRLKPDQIEKTFVANMPPEKSLILSENTPLIYYLLAEAEIQTGGKSLGEVGGRIVAEVFLKLLKESPFSILRKDLKTDKDFLGNEFGGKFGMVEMLKFNNKYKTEGFDEINPIKNISA